MKTTLCFAFLILCLTCRAGAASIDDAQTFRDLTFDQDRATISGLSAAELDPKDGVQYYKRDSDSRLVESLKATWIIYGFKHEKLKEVLIQFVPETDGPVLEFFSKKWGSPLKESEKSKDGSTRDRYTWKGHKVTAVLVCTKLNVYGTSISMQPLLSLESL